ncbi:YbgC/FadM family acyl-CoA thioesterase [Sphingosinicellaceae bacterium]|nr:YbgC/FadM family acyl-CoA thioesterase [Sphingosinicellaceae bacterium]
MPSLPASGDFRHGVHHFPVRVYFEDTDLTGVVYHANYLRYMERARSDMLALAGIDQLEVMSGGRGYYAVADLRIAYKRPAKLGDGLEVRSRVLRVRAAAVLSLQQVWRGDEMLTEGHVTAAWLDRNGRPQRQPADRAALFEQMRVDAETADHSSAPADTET